MKDCPVAREEAEAIPTNHFDLDIGVVALIIVRFDTESALKEGLASAYRQVSL